MNSKKDSVAGAHLEEKKPVWLGGRGARLTKYQKLRIKKFCLDRDGLKCMLCNTKADFISLQIHHKDGNAANHFSNNLELAHGPCNSRKNNELYHSGKESKLSVQLKREKMVAMHTLGDADIGTTEIRLNREYEPLFRRCCFQLLLNTNRLNEAVTRNAMRVTVREIVGCSQSASYSYMERLFDGMQSPLSEEEDFADGTFFVKFSFKEDRKLTLKELEDKYPKWGQRFRKDPEMNKK